MRLTITHDFTEWIWSGDWLDYQEIQGQNDDKVNRCWGTDALRKHDSADHDEHKPLGIETDHMNYHWSKLRTL